MSSSVVAIGLFLIAFGSRAEDPATDALTCFSSSWNRHDMQAFGQCFASDADFVNVTTQWWKGREALEKNHAYLHGTIAPTDRNGITVPQGTHGMFKDTTLTFTSSDTRYLGDGVALVHVAWQITGDPRTPEPRKGFMLLVLTKNDRSWQIASVQNTELNRNVR
jgi:ketosteroid isomerase-like protein